MTRSPLNGRDLVQAFAVQLSRQDGQLYMREGEREGGGDAAVRRRRSENR